MNNEVIGFLLSNIKNLTGFSFFLIVVFSLIFSGGMFIVYRWIYKSLVDSQKELIDAKSALVQHYQHVTSELTQNLAEVVQSTKPQIRNDNNSGEQSNHVDMDSQKIIDALTMVSLKYSRLFYLSERLLLLKSFLWVLFSRAKSAESAANAVEKLLKIDEISRQLHALARAFDAATNITPNGGAKANFAKLRSAIETSFTKQESAMEDMETAMRTELLAFNVLLP